MADYRCPYGYGWCEVPYKDYPHWQGTFCELDVEAEKMDELKPCPFCGGEVEETGGSCNFWEEDYDAQCKVQKMRNIRRPENSMEHERIS